MIKYTPEIIQFISKHRKNCTLEELIPLLKQHYGITCTKMQLKGVTCRYKIKAGNDGRYQKGSTPYNKGQKGLHRSIATEFGKGHLPQNYKPVGSERISSKDGYHIIKIADPRIWVHKHKWLYEQHHGVKIQPGQCVIFIDGDKNNLAIENLILMDRKHLAPLNKFYKDIHGQTKLSAINLIKLNAKIKQLETPAL